MPPKVTRESLIRKAEQGELSSQEAEAEATNLGLAPLADEPDYHLFGVMDQTEWTIPQAIAWIIWREEKAVAWQLPEARAQRREWKYYGDDPAPNLVDRHIHWSLVRKKDFDVVGGLGPYANSCWDDIYPKLVGRPRAAFYEIRGAAQAGRLDIIAQVSSGGDFAAISDSELGKLRPVVNDDFESINLEIWPSVTKKIYVHATVERKKILKNWPVGKSKNGKFSSESVRKWLISEVTLHEIPRKRKADYQYEANINFGCSKRSFDSIWREVVDNSRKPRWRHPGRPRKIPSAENPAT